MATAKKNAQAAPSKTVTSAERRRRRGDVEHETIEVTLAHYLPDGNPFTGQEQEAGDKITVKRHEARHLIGAGYAAVDREDADAVAAALQLSPGEPGGSTADE